MHFRFRGNPNTNDAARLLLENQRRAKKGLPPLSMGQWVPGGIGPPGPALDTPESKADFEEIQREDAKAAKKTQMQLF